MFDETPTAEHWFSSAKADVLGYEHVLAEAGEAPLDQDTLTTARRRQDRGPGYYSDLLFALTHKHYAANEAQPLWSRILGHRDLLATQLGRSPGVAVAALDYLLNVEGSLARPTLIDELKLARLVDSATHDGLTGLFDRATLNLVLQRSFAAGVSPLSLIMIDLDHFKRFNDQHGHLAGDAALMQVSAIVRQSVRDTDLPARFGGEELCIVLPNRTLEEAANIAERLRARIERELGARAVTASLGVANSPAHARDPRGLLDAADRALYVAKRSGRNRVNVCSSRAQTERSSDYGQPRERALGPTTARTP